MHETDTESTVENEVEIGEELLIAMGDELRKTDKSVTELVSDCCERQLESNQNGGGLTRP